MVYENLVNLIHKVDDKLNFDWSDKYGWLTINPFNIGSSIRCKVRIQYAGATEALAKFCKLNDIQLVILSENDAQIVEVTNGKVFELSEFDCLKLFYDNLTALIEMLANEQNDQENSGNAGENGNDGKSPNHSIEEISKDNIEQAMEENADVNEKVECTEALADKIADNVENTENEMNEGKESSIIGESNIDVACDEQTNTKEGIAEVNEAVADREDASVDNAEEENEVNVQGEEAEREKIPNEEAPNAEVSNEEEDAPNGNASNKESSIEEAPNEEAPNEEAMNEETPNEQAPEEQTPNDEASIE